MVERADINSVLSDIRALRSQMNQPQGLDQNKAIQGQVSRPERSDQVRETPGFSDMLSQAVGQVNDLQQTSGDMKTAYQQGDPNMDISRVMVASQKASVSFEALTQVRNRVVKAYEDIMNMPV
ncbi:MAG: flagellar hook-basal body complex protein FliE [Oleiphilaceae bacterium]|nr:flagellar hook-basal body complex protein FliE [Oleiphilaceae bacterium]